MKKSIKFKFIFIFSIILIIACNLIGFITFSSTSAIVTDVITSQATNIAQQAVNRINIEKYGALINSSEETDYYYELREQLSELRETFGIEYLYTMNRTQTETGFKYVYMVDGMPIGDEDASAFLEEEEINNFPGMVKVFDTEKTVVEMSESDDYGALATAYVPINGTNGEFLGVMGADIDVSSFYNSLAKEKLVTLLTTSIILLIGIVIVYFFTTSMTKPIQHLTKQVQQLGNGHLLITSPSNRKDEIGKLTNAIHQMATDIRTVIQRIKASSLILADTSTKLLHNTNETKDASDQISFTMEELAEKSSSQFHSLNESAKVMEEMAIGVTQIAEAASTASNLSYQSLSEVKQGNDAIHTVIQQMNTIQHSVLLSADSMQILKNHAADINSIITFIQELSAQTNLLALNAAIEAARAGEAGKGFAVVANEVRKLAEQTAQSTSGIQSILDQLNKGSNNTAQAMDTMIADVREGLKSVEGAKKAFDRILQSINEMSNQVLEVSTTAEQMTASSEEISASAHESSTIAKETSASTQETVYLTSRQQDLMNNVSKSIEDITSMSVELKQLTSKFTI